MQGNARRTVVSASRETCLLATAVVSVDRRLSSGGDLVLSALHIDSRVADQRPDCRRPHVLCRWVSRSKGTVQGRTARHSGKTPSGAGEYRYASWSAGSRLLSGRG